MPLLQVRGLEKWYGRRQVVNGVDYEVERGEVVGLLGPNGAGKTTSFRMTIGLIDADGGTVLFDGRDVTRLPMYLRAVPGMGYLAQDSSVFRQLSVEDNLMAILETRTHLSRKQRKDRQNELLDQFGLTKIRKTKANRVSGGERRRLEIARSLITEPKMIMLDEPFAGIDPKTVTEIQDQIRDLVERYNIGILLDRPPVPRDARGHRSLLPDPRGASLRLRKPRTDPARTPMFAGTTSVNASTSATCSIAAARSRCRTSPSRTPPSQTRQIPGSFCRRSWTSLSPPR